MTEEELVTFIKNNKESLTFEYKLKPNFHDIKESIDAIKERMHFKILRTIYAFANTEGGELYIGIKDKNSIVKSVGDTDRKRIEGVDDCDIEIVERTILKQVNPIIKTEQETIQLKNGRVVIKIKVYPLKIYDKPLFVDGILYVRENNTTKAEKNLGDYLSLYKDKQLYMCYEIGIKNNLKKLIKQRESFELNQFIEGLKVHIKSLIEKNQVTGYEEKLRETEKLLDQIKQKIIDSGDLLQGTLPASFSDLDSLVDKFTELYKAIISEV